MTLKTSNEDAMITISSKTSAADIEALKDQAIQAYATEGKPTFDRVCIELTAAQLSFLRGLTDEAYENDMIDDMTCQMQGLIGDAEDMVNEEALRDALPYDQRPG